MATQTITHSDDEYIKRVITDKPLAHSEGPTRSLKVSGTKLGATGNLYADGELVGNLLKLENVVRDIKGYATLMAIIMQDLSDQKSKLEMIIFDADPAATTFTDNAVLDIADADLPKEIGKVIIAASDYDSYTDNAVSTTRNIGLPLKSDSGRDLWVCFVARGTPTYVADELGSVISFY